MTKEQVMRTGLIIQSVLCLSTAYAYQEPIDPLALNNADIENGLIASKRTDTSIQYFLEMDESTNEDKQEFTAPEIQLSSSTKTFVASYLKENKASLEKIKARSNSWFQMIDKIFIAKGIPPELKYLAVIESKLKTNAVSHAGAVGAWQFMPATARYMGLKVTSKVDERKHSYKSTVAAAKYLKDLYAMFDDWLLVIAAYNAGPGTVMKVIKKTGTRNFYKLQYHLPLETRLHVKRFIGAHYFFQPEGSETVLTKYELQKHNEKVNQFLVMRKKLDLPPEVVTIEIENNSIAEAITLIPSPNENIETTKSK